MPGVLKVIRDGSFLAVIAEREFQAVKAMRMLAKAAKWSDGTPLPDPANIYALLESAPVQDSTIRDTHGDAMPSMKSIEAVYHRPYQMHGSIGPSCAVALFDNDQLTVWSHAQGMFPLRKAIAELVHLPDTSVRCIHTEGSGCYGHNGADDAGGDAAVLARAMPGRPVRVQWMREQEHTWEPYGPAMSSRAKAAIDAEGTIVDFQYEVWSNTHSMRPGPAGNLLAGQYVAETFKPAPPRPLPQPDGGGDRNAIPLYRLPNARIVSHFIAPMPLRVSAMRGLGAYHNIFAIESFMDELALAAGIDPVAFRLKHLDDPRARDVVTRAAEAFGWTGAVGQGFAFARYKNSGAYCAVALALDVEHETGRLKLDRVAAAVDSGEAVNPDGIRNQIEGGIVQSLSWTMYEEVTWNDRRITSSDWGRYPILRFRSVPASVEVHVIDRPGEPFLGTGEAAQGPASAALANGLAHAAGVRLRDLPLSQEKVKAAIGV
jgi:CO/xanthine dehydrogenase Mo-binding subunit